MQERRCLLGQARGNAEGFSRPVTGIMSAHSPLTKASHMVMLIVDTSPAPRERKPGQQAVQSVYHGVYIRENRI